VRALFADRRRRPVSGSHHGRVVECEQFEADAVEDVGVAADRAERAADAAREERVAGEDRGAEEEARTAVGMAAFSPNGSSSPSTIGLARLPSSPIAATSERCMTISASGKAAEMSAVASQ
jgi:hypothetical protein